MSGRFPKCLTPGCRRLLIKKTSSQQLTCGGCRQSYHVADLVNAEQNASAEKNTSDVSSEQQQNTSQQKTLLSDDDDMQKPPIRTSTYPSVHQKYPNMLESLNGHNRNSSESSLGTEDYARFGSEDYVEREQGTRLEKTIVPPTRRPSSYNPSVSSKSISSDEGGSTISRNRNARSMRTHRRRESTASTDDSVTEIQIRDGNLRDDSNYEDGKIRQGFIETNYPLNESKWNQQADRFHGRIISQEKNVEREQDYAINGNFPYQRGRGLNSSFGETTSSRNIDFPYGYKSNPAQESEGTKPVFSESNYSLKQPNINLNVQGDLIDDCTSIHGSFVSEEEFEERAHRSGRNSNASFEGSISSRSFSSDEGGSRIGIGETRFNSRQTYKPRGLSDNTYDITYSAPQFNGVEKTSIPSQQNELNDLVKELTIMGITREKLLLSLLKQTEASIKENLMHQNRNTRSLVRKLSVQIPSSPQVSDSGSSRGNRRSAMHHCRPILGGTPFITCTSCSLLLQLPIVMPAKKLVKIRCGECSGTQVCPFPAKGATYNPLHKAMGYESARFLMAPSRQFSLMDDDMLN